MGGRISGRRKRYLALPVRDGVRRPPREGAHSLKKLWETGEALCDAWHTFAEPFEYEGWRSCEDAGDTGPTAARASLMQANLIEKIQAGELIAVGIRESNQEYRGPEIIPTDLFDISRDAVEAIFVSSSRLKLAGRSWTRVRVTEFRLKKPTRVKPRTKAPGKKKVEILSPPDPSDRPPSKPRRGRPRIDSYLDEVVSRLNARGELSAVSRKVQETRVRAKAQLEFPNVFRTQSSPSLTKILLALAKVGYGPKSP